MPLTSSWETNFRGGKEKNMDKGKIYMQILICSANNTSTLTFMLNSFMQELTSWAPGEHRHEIEVQGHIIQYTQACDLTVHT